MKIDSGRLAYLGFSCCLLAGLWLWKGWPAVGVGALVLISLDLNGRLLEWEDNQPGGLYGPDEKPRRSFLFMNKHRLCLLSYWLLFIIAPLVAYFSYFRFSTPAFGGGILLFVVVLIIGSHGYRPWKRIFGIDVFTSEWPAQQPPGRQMMFVLRDDPIVEVFESPQRPPNWIEAIDVKNREYTFFDDAGQEYCGVIKERDGSWPLGFALEPTGQPDVPRCLDILEKAELIEPNPWFKTLDDVRLRLRTKNQAANEGDLDNG